MNLRQGAVTVVGLVLVLLLTLAILTPNPFESARLLAVGAFGGEIGITRTLVKWIPLTLAGLGVVVAWRGGMYNIGGEGQFVVGGIAGAFAAKPILEAAPGWSVAAPLILGAATLAGAAWGWIAAWLFVRRGVEVVISTILMNFVAIQMLAYLVSGPMRERSGRLPQTDRLPDASALPKFDPRFDLHYGIALALVAAALVYVFLYLTKQGFQLRLVGENARAARANRISAPRGRLLAMSVSGGLCGLAGGVEYMGVTQQLGQGFSQNWGFLAIPVALLAGLHPIGVCLSALYFAAILAGSRNLAGFTADGTVLIYIVQAAAVLGLVALGKYKGKAAQPMEAA
jgi:ABC-type uncharacterized transport system permease subunit